MSRRIEDAEVGAVQSPQSSVLHPLTTIFTINSQNGIKVPSEYQASPLLRASQWHNLLFFSSHKKVAGCSNANLMS
jgi:hypothetical protein